MIKVIRNFLEGLTKAWRGLNSETKNTILTISSMVGALSALTLVIVGIIKLAPLVKGLGSTFNTAFKAMTSPLGILLIALTVLAFGFLKFKDEILDALEPLGTAFEDVGKTIGDVIKPITKFFKEDKFSDFGDNAETGAKKISIFGTVVVSVFKIIGSALLIIVRGFEIFFVTVSKTIHALDLLAKAAKAAILGKTDIAAEYKKGADSLFEVVKVTIDKKGKLLKHELAKIWKDGFLVFDSKKESRKVDKLFNQVETKTKKLGKSAKENLNPFEQKIRDLIVAFLLLKLSGNFSDFISNLDNFQKAFLAMAEAVANKAAVIIGIFRGFADIAAANIQRSQKILERDMAVRLGKIEQAVKIELEMINQLEDAKAAAIEKGFDEEIDRLKQQENDKFLILENASKQRLLLLDDEFQKAKEMRESEFQIQMEKERERFEIEKALLLEKADDNEQRKIIETLLDEDFKNLLENMQNDFDSGMLEFAKDFANKSKIMDEEKSNKKISLEERLAKKIERLEAKKNRKLLKAEARKNRKLERLERQRQKKEKILQRELTKSSWEAQKAEFQATKNIQRAETLVSGIAAASQAYAALAPIPVAGPALGAAAAAAVMELTRQRLKQIDKQKPIKPAELMLERGGFIGGNITHAQGGILANVESKESFIDKIRSQKIVNFIDKGLQKTENNERKIVIIFETGAIVTNNEFVSSEMVERLSVELGKRIEDKGIFL